MERVDSLEDALTVVRVRNTCRQFMTRDQREISPQGQEEWWSSLDHGEYRLYLLNSSDGPIGFGLLKTVDKVWLTGGLLPEHRGMGLGAELFKTLCQEASEMSYHEAWLDVFASNVPAVRTYEKLGFVRQSEEGGVIVMKKELEKGIGQ